MVVEKNKSVSRLGSGDNTIDCLFFAAICCRVWQCAAMCCSVLQRVAVFCSVSHCVALCCSISFRVERQYDKLSLDYCLVSSFGSKCVAVCCSVLQCVAVCCSVMQCIALYYIWQQCRLAVPTLLHNASHSNTLITHYNTLQHTVTHCNTLQHTWLAVHTETLNPAGFEQRNPTVGSICSIPAIC